MLTSTPTPYGAGITLYGDFLDLDTLHHTITKIAGEGQPEDPPHDFMLALAYDVRKAKENQREVRKFGVAEEDSVQYRGVPILWPQFLIQVAMLRQHAGYRDTDRRDQAFLYMLESCAISSLLAFDPKVGGLCAEAFLRLPTFPNDYLFEYVNQRVREFVSIPGKKRFGTLPGLLRSCIWVSPEYTAFAKELKEQARRQGCSPHELSDRRDFPNFRW